MQYEFFYPRLAVSEGHNKIYIGFFRIRYILYSITNNSYKRFIDYKEPSETNYVIDASTRKTYL